MAPSACRRSRLRSAGCAVRESLRGWARTSRVRDPLPPAERADADRVTAAARAALGPAAFDRAFLHGAGHAPESVYDRLAEYGGAAGP